MREREQYVLAITTAETMYNLWELEYQQGELDLDALMRRLKDLSAYSLTHAEILNQQEGVELLALGMFFGATSNSSLHKNQERLQALSKDILVYQGNAEVIEQEVAQRKASRPDREEGGDSGPYQPPLL